MRDLLLQPALLPHDFDMTCFSTEEQLVKALRGFSCRKRGAGSFDITVAGTHVEVTIARKEGPYSDKRHPDWIEPGNLLDDYVRRDFTVNAIYLDILNCELWDVGGGVPV